MTDLDRVKMTADRFFPIDLAIIVRLFDPAFDDAVGILIAISAHLTFDGGGDPTEFPVVLISSHGFDLLDARCGEIRFDCFVYFVETVQFFLFKRRTGVAIFAATPFAFCKIADELRFNYRVAYQNVINGYHIWIFVLQI